MCMSLCVYWCSSRPAVYACVHVSVMWLVWCVCKFCVHSGCFLSALMLLQQASCSLRVCKRARAPHCSQCVGMCHPVLYVCVHMACLVCIYVVCAVFFVSKQLHAQVFQV